jgi:WD40 repeat protein
MTSDDANVVCGRLVKRALLTGMCAATSIAVSPALTRGDLLAASGGGTNIVRFDGSTGAVVGDFTTSVSYPRLMTFGPDGNLYVADYGGGSGVLRFNGTTGASMGVFATGGLASPTGVTFSPGGDLFATSCGSPNVIRFNGSTGAYVGVFATTPNGSACLVGIQFGPNGDLLVAEQNSNSIQRYNGTTGAYIGVFASGNGLMSPEGITVHGGDVYVANYSGNDVLRFNGTTGSFVSVFVPAGSGGLIGPYDLAFGPDGNLYVGSYTNSNVVKYDGTTGAFVSVFASGGGLANTVGIAFTGVGVPQTYCTAGTTTNGCSASISASANPSLAQTSACNITVTGVEGIKSGILFYGINNTGFTPGPWGSGSASLLCVKHPTQRTPLQSSGGTLNACNGAFALDWNAFQSAHPLALGNPWSVGSKVYAQAWFRDPAAVKATNLSNAVEMTYVP